MLKDNYIIYNEWKGEIVMEKVFLFRLLCLKN